MVFLVLLFGFIKQYIHEREHLIQGSVMWLKLLGGIAEYFEEVLINSGIAHPSGVSTSLSTASPG